MEGDHNTGALFDVIVVGGGLSGLSAASYLLKVIFFMLLFD
jgi:flavin-dependent dehydrogenase